MTAVVTGASGHVGAALVRALLKRGESVRAIVKSDTRAVEGLGVDVRKVDVTSESDVNDAIRGADVVYHAAARVTLEAEADEMADLVNVRGTRNVIAACRSHGVRRLVHFSTAHALGKEMSLLADGAGLPYERSKAAAERDVLAAAERDLDAVIVSPCAVVGPFDHKPSYIGRVLIMLSKGLLPAVVNGGQSWVDVRDIASSAIAAAEKGERGGRYVLGGHWHTMFDFMKMAARPAGARAPMVRLPPGVARGFAPLASKVFRLLKQEPLFTKASLDALELEARPVDEGAARVLGHAPRPIEETLDDTFAWFTERGLVRRRER